MPRYARWAERLAGVERLGRTRTLRTLEPTGPVTGRLDGRDVLVACSNDYLGLGTLPLAGRSGSGGSRLISGNHREHGRLERALASWLERDVLLFPSGWHANVAVFSTVCTADQRVASDALNHASVIDGLRLSRAQRIVVPHLDPSAVPDSVDLIALEGLYSMDGDIAPLASYPRGPWLAVDEAHSIGCLGPGGGGVAAAQGVAPDILVGTFGKAFGSTGAFVAGPPELIALLVNAARSFIFTTSAPPGLLAVLADRLATIAAADDLRDRLAHNAATLRRHLADLGWTVLGDAHILPVLTGRETMEVADRLLRAGVFAPGIRHPTVPVGLERVRLTVSAAHTDIHLERIAEAFGPA